METIHSKDKTLIAFDKHGDGPAIILVDGALGSRTFSHNAQLTTHLSEAFTVYHYDRRGRGDSGDSPSYAVAREIEDIEALIDHAGGSAYLFGMSSGAILALEAARQLKGKITKLALYEPPFILDDSRPPLPTDYVEQLNTAIDTSDRGKAIEIFMTQAVMVPKEYLEPMRSDPMWAGMEAVAHTLAYDGLVSREYMAGTPWDAGTWAEITAETVVITGENSEPFFHSSAETLANDLPTGSSRSLPGQDHNVAPDALAPLLIAFFQS